MKLINRSIVTTAIASIMLSSCSVGPEPIAFGSNDCDHCKMTISDNRYGAELVTKKGRVYKFDDLHCLKDFLKDGVVSNDNINSLWVVDFSKKDTLINVEKSFLLHNPELKSPMGSNIAAFEIEDSINSYYTQYAGTKLKWVDYYSK